MTDFVGSGRSIDGVSVRPDQSARRSSIVRHHTVGAREGDRGKRLRRGTSAVARVLADVAVPAVVAISRPELAAGAVIFAAGVTLGGRWFGLYRERFTQSVLDEVLRLILMVASGGALAAVGVRMVGKDHTPNLTQLGVLTLLVLLIGRAMLYRFEAQARRRGRRMLGRALVVGGGTVAGDLIRRISEHPELGLSVGGVLDRTGRTSNGWPVLGTIQDLPLVLREHQIDIVLMALPDVPEGEVFRVIRNCEFGASELYTVCAWFSLRGGHGPTADQIWGIPVSRVTPARRVGIARRVKRGTDILVAGFALVLLSPLLGLLGLAVFAEGGGNVIFRQVRVGLDGKLITIMKFRTMRPAAVKESDTTWSIAGDARIGPVGRFLRASSLDELPQLVNVLRGEMSLVGPRPERPHFVSLYEPLVPDYHYRHRMQAGMTGYAAVQGLRGDTSIAERAYFDNLYIENWSLGLDVRILCRTVLEVVRRRGG
ncbi:MAG: exopolysaccharide biosynthesis polyprenyl glycosylphosphotransferase [Actinomycetota bacterium]|nr:exopolysaccharide biosynthesis polyprenyl glycosylphosphotransferase [Actinomycetota bacterium]